MTVRIREPRHGHPALTADVAALRLQHLLLRGFTIEAADKVFEAIDLPDQDRRPARAGLRRPGEDDHQLAGDPGLYARERVLLCGRIVVGLDDRADSMLARLINKPRATIEAVAAAKPRTWHEARAILTAMRKVGAP